MKIAATKSPVRILTGVAVVTIALVLGGAGGATAGRLITGKQIKDNTVASADIKNKTITTTDLASATITALAGKPGAAGAQGPAGETGPVGARGPVGANGMTDVTMRSQNITLTTGEQTVDVYCAPDERAVSSAHQTLTTNGAKPVITSSYPIRPDGEAATASTGPIPAGSGWRTTLANYAAGTTVTASIAVVCAAD
ncbi:hypothetical protein GCM10009795_005370 [Nocardioides hankookensis]|uniref:Collagen-like protein n=1 Tax=Nocardioides hankookensis TaxID=443157 RepID=A0ABW1LGC6_9ACTN